jgi:hypothetical protein
MNIKNGCLIIIFMVMNWAVVPQAADFDSLSEERALIASLRLNIPVLESVLKNDLTTAIESNAAIMVASEFPDAVRWYTPSADFDSSIILSTTVQGLGVWDKKAEKRIFHESIASAVQSIDWRSCLMDASEEKAIALGAMIQRIMINWADIISGDSPALFWCGCTNASDYRRITLIIETVKDLLSNYKPTERVVYTSFASGRLLLDYLIISEFKRYGFGVQGILDINFIDIAIGDSAQTEEAVKIASRLEHIFKHSEQGREIDTTKHSSDEITAMNRVRNAHQRFVEHIMNKADNGGQGFDFAVADFERRLGVRKEYERLGKGKEQPGIYVTLYASHTDYLQSVQKYKKQGTNILVMADPDSILFSTDYPASANGLAITVGSYDVFMLSDPETLEDFIRNQPDFEAHLKVESSEKDGGETVSIDGISRSSSPKVVADSATEEMSTTSSSDDEPSYPPSFVLFFGANDTIYAYENLASADLSPELSEYARSIYSTLQNVIKRTKGKKVSAIFQELQKEFGINTFDKTARQDKNVSIFPLSDAWIAVGEIAAQ